MYIYTANTVALIYYACCSSANFSTLWIFEFQKHEILHACVYTGVLECTNYHTTIVVMTKMACCIEIMHIYYAHRDLLEFEPTFSFHKNYNISIIIIS